MPEVNGILDRLLLFLGYEKDYVTAETLVQMAVVLRRYPDAAEACVDSIVEVNPEVGGCLKRMVGACLGRV